MHKIVEMLEKHEKWVETLEPHGDDAAKLQHWDLILQQMEHNLTLHEMIANITNAQSEHPQTSHTRMKAHD